MTTNYVPCGVIIPLSYEPSTIPEDFLLCDGSSYTTTNYPNLFTLIGYTYGGSGSTFNVPDLRDKRGYMDSNSSLGTISGVNSIILNNSQLPQHTHNVNSSSYSVEHSHPITYNSGTTYTSYINPDTNDTGQAGAVHQKGLNGISTTTFNANETTGESSSINVSGESGDNTSNVASIPIINPFLKMYFYIKY
jgi:microcystin-dependent protein